MGKLTAFMLLGSSLVACMGNGAGEEVSTESALDSADSVQAEGSIMMANIDGTDMTAFAPLAADVIAARIAANMELRWPNSCRTIAQAGNSITVTYNDCTGPRGLVHVSGQLVLTVDVKLDGTIAIHG